MSTPSMKAQRSICLATAGAAALMIASTALAHDVWITVDAEDHTTTEATLATVRELRTEFSWLGMVLQAGLHRTADDCREFSGPDARVRLCKGAYRESASVAYQRKSEIDAAYLRCLEILLAGAGYPMVATHDPELIAAAQRLAAPDQPYEHQMLYGIREPEQLRLAQAGHKVRVYLPYGDQWYPYFMRRLAERPANLTFFLRALVSRS